MIIDEASDAKKAIDVATSLIVTTFFIGVLFFTYLLLIIKNFIINNNYDTSKCLMKNVYQSLLQYLMKKDLKKEVSGLY